MRKLVALLAIATLVPSVMAVLAGCGSTALTEQPVVAPSGTTALLPKPTATSHVSSVDDSVPTSTLVPTADDGLEFAPVDSVGSSGKQEPIAVVDPDSPQKSAPGATGPVEGDAYTWQDGDRTMTVRLQSDLIVEKSSGGLPRDVVFSQRGWS